MPNYFGHQNKRYHMHKKILLLICFLPSLMLGHSLLLNVFDNEDNTITVEGVFNTGELAVGALIRLESLSTGEVIYKKRLPDESELTIEVPKEPYQIVLDGGPGHQVVQKGIAPLEGFSKEASVQTTAKLSQPQNGVRLWTMPLVCSLIVVFISLLATLLICKRNTNKILESLQASKGISPQS